MTLRSLVATASLLCATPALAMTAAQERQFLDDQHLTQRMATIVKTNAPVESWVTNQGGSSGKACDGGGTIQANVMTQVSSDNDTNNGNPGTWQNNGHGHVALLNTGKSTAVCTADFFYGDQTQEGSNLSGYFHVIEVQWKNIAANSGDQIGWDLLNTVPLLADHEGDAMAYYLYLTCSQTVKCTLNGYDTTEFGQ